MKKLYTLILLLCVFNAQTQTFDFSIDFKGTNSITNNYQFALVATPSATITNGNTADMGAGFYIPLGLTIGNFETGNSNIPASEWSSQDLGNSNSSGDPYFVSRTEAGSSSVLLNGDGPFELVLFDLIADPNPTSGNITFVENGDPVFNEILFIENYMNINLGSGTVNAYNQNDPSASSISFETLSINPQTLSNNSVNIYPNPVKEMATVLFSGTIDSAELYDITGKLIQTFYSKELNLSSLKAGVYLTKIRKDNTTVTKKIVKN